MGDSSLFNIIPKILFLFYLTNWLHFKLFWLSSLAVIATSVTRILFIYATTAANLIVLSITMFTLKYTDPLYNNCCNHDVEFVSYFNDEIHFLNMITNTKKPITFS